MLNAGSLRALVENPVFLSGFTSWLLAQLLKTLIVLFGRRRASAKDAAVTILWKTGGMPSSHSALVNALAISIGFSEGFSSNLFIVTLAFSLIVMRDALGVRRSSGMQARLLNNLGRDIDNALKIPFSPVKEVLGHTPLEVLVGALLGLSIGAAFSIL